MWCPYSVQAEAAHAQTLPQLLQPDFAGAAVAMAIYHNAPNPIGRESNIIVQGAAHVQGWPADNMRGGRFCQGDSTLQERVPAGIKYSKGSRALRPSLGRRGTGEPQTRLIKPRKPHPQEGVGFLTACARTRRRYSSRF